MRDRSWRRPCPSGRRLAASLLLLAIGTMATGCGSGTGNPARMRVAGTVTLDSQPAPAGTIVFVPLVAGQFQAQGIIQEDGTFAIAAEDGPSVGEYKVEIQCARKTGRKVQSLSSSDGSGTIDERVPVIPAQYNQATTITKTITNGENVFQFDLKSKP